MEMNDNQAYIWRVVSKFGSCELRSMHLVNGNGKQVEANVTLYPTRAPVCAKWTTERCAACRWVGDWDFNKIIICIRYVSCLTPFVAFNNVHVHKNTPLGDEYDVNFSLFL